MDDETLTGMARLATQFEEQTRSLWDVLPKGFGDSLRGIDSLVPLRDMAEATGLVAGLAGFPKGLFEVHSEAARQIAESIGGVRAFENSVASAAASAVASLPSQNVLGQIIAKQSEAYRSLAESYAGMTRSIVDQIGSGIGVGLERMMDVCGHLTDLPWPTAHLELDQATMDAVTALQETVTGQATWIEKLCETDFEVADPRPTAVDFLEAELFPSIPESPLKILRARFSQVEGVNQLTLAKLCLKQQLWPEAEYHSREAAEWMEDSPDPLIGLGIALNAQGRHEAAVEAFEDAERRDPECTTRADVRAIFEASLQGRRWNGRLDDDPGGES